MKKEYKMSAARQQELQDELTYLKTVREKGSGGAGSKRPAASAT